MEMLFLGGIILLNLAISVWNCFAVGRVWNDVKIAGNWFDKLLVWSGVTQAAVGFSMPIMLVLSWATLSYMTTGEKPSLSPEEASEMMQGIFSLWYIAVIFPILGTGLAITAHSIRVAYKRRDFGSVAVASWNTFAQIHNTVGAVNNLGGAFGDVGKLFSGGGDSKGKALLAMILIVFIAIAGGFLIAISIVKAVARRSPSSVEAYAAQYG